MLSTKNTYALLCIFSMQLGCSSTYRYQMEEEYMASGPSSSGSKSSSRASAKDEKSLERMFNIVDKFLKKQGEKIKRRSTIDDEVIKLAISKIDKNINNIDVNLLPIHYRSFLATYGSIYGKGHDICGPFGEITNEKKASHIASVQRGFKENCKKLNKKPEQIKLYWLISEINNIDQYYIDLSKEGRIYSIDFEGNSRFFAKNFIDFLERFFISFENCEDSE